MKDGESEKYKIVAQHFAFEWNPLVNPDIFKMIQQNILNYFENKTHTLDDFEIKSIKEYYNIL